ncbi:MAG: hypothetical protein ABWZ65_06600, partial [Pseudomonas mandelii]
TWDIEANSGCESHGDQLPFPSRVRGLTELLFGVASTWAIEVNSGCESHGDRLPFPSPLWGEGWGEGLVFEGGAGFE